MGSVSCQRSISKNLNRISTCIVPRAQLAHVKINTGCIELCMSGDFITMKIAALNLLSALRIRDCWLWERRDTLNVWRRKTAVNIFTLNEPFGEIWSPSTDDTEENNYVSKLVCGVQPAAAEVDSDSQLSLMSDIQLICHDSSEHLSIPQKLPTARQAESPTDLRQQSQELCTPAFCLQRFWRGQSSDLSLGPVNHGRGCVTEADGWRGWVGGKGSGACSQVVTSRNASSSEWVAHGWEDMV